MLRRHISPEVVDTEEDRQQGDLSKDPPDPRAMGRRTGGLQFVKWPADRLDSCLRHAATVCVE
jgi:hypothetical protein